jgi:hypothetical protein
VAGGLAVEVVRDVGAVGQRDEHGLAGEGELRVVGRHGGGRRRERDGCGGEGEDA